MLTCLTRFVQALEDRNRRSKSREAVTLTTEEEETQKMRAELLAKEKELIELKRRQLDMQIANLKTSMKVS